MYTKERTRGITIQTLDLTPIYEQIAEKIREFKPDVDAVKSSYNWALATDRHGRRLLVCDEGVYWGIGTNADVRPAGAFGPAPFDIYDATERRNEEGNLLMSIMPLAEVNLALEDVEPLVSGEVDLADFIRTFGARLEQNFWNLHEEITGGNA
jgi:hypothetical protein